MWTTAISGSVTSFLVNPFWVLQTTTALSQTNESMVVAAKRLVRNDGMASLWKGLSSSLILVSNPIIQFCVYEWLKARLPASKGTKMVYAVGLAKDILIFLIAALSKAIATILTYPYTVIRTYQHLNKSEKPFSEIVRELYAEGGLLRFFKGISMLI
jgi:adenine nucleotide transporter 17